MPSVARAPEPAIACPPPPPHPVTPTARRAADRSVARGGKPAGFLEFVVALPEGLQLALARPEVPVGLPQALFEFVVQRPAALLVHLGVPVLVLVRLRALAPAPAPAPAPA